MPPEPRPELQPGIPEPRNTAIVARAAGAEEAKTTSVAARDWAIAPTPIPPDTTDAELVALWLHGKSPNTIRAYGDDVAAFRRFTGKPLRATYLSDLQRYADSLVGAPATRGRRLKTLKSLLSFATRMGYLPFNAGAAIHGPALEQKLAERILSERQVFALLEAVEDRPRDHALIRLLYNGGLRVSELVTLRWRNLVEGVANVTGKGGKTRVVRLSRGDLGGAASAADRRDHRRGLRLPDERCQRVEAGQARGPAGRDQRGPGLAALPTPLPRHPCPAARGRSGDRARHPR
jgi:integrase